MSTSSAPKASPAPGASAVTTFSVASPTAGREPSIFLISLHMIMWTNLLCGLIMVMVVYLLNQ